MLSKFRKLYIHKYLMKKQYKMVGFIERILNDVGVVIGGLVWYNAVKFSIGNQERKVRLQIVIVSSNEPVHYPF